MASRYCLKIYSELLGVLVSFCAFIWVIFHIFIMWQTSQSYNDDLRMARYLGKIWKNRWFKAIFDTMRIPIFQISVLEY